MPPASISQGPFPSETPFGHSSPKNRAHGHRAFTRNVQHWVSGIEAEVSRSDRGQTGRSGPTRPACGAWARRRWGVEPVGDSVGLREQRCRDGHLRLMRCHLHCCVHCFNRQPGGNTAMAVLCDDQFHKTGGIDPLANGQPRSSCITYGVAGYRRDVRVGTGFQCCLSTTSDGTGIVDPNRRVDDLFSSLVTNDMGCDHVVIPSNSFASRERRLLSEMTLDVGNRTSLPVKPYVTDGVARMALRQAEQICTTNFSHRRGRGQAGHVSAPKRPHVPTGRRMTTGMYFAGTRQQTWQRSQALQRSQGRHQDRLMSHGRTKADG